MRKAEEPGEPLAVAMLDVDHFKTINDLHGHDEGDRVLVALADMLKSRSAGRGLAPPWRPITPCMRPSAAGATRLVAA